MQISDTLVWRIAIKEWEESTPLSGTELWYPSAEYLWERGFLTDRAALSLVDFCNGKVDQEQQKELDKLEARVGGIRVLA